VVRYNVDIGSPWPSFSNMCIFLITFFDRLFFALLFHVTNIFFFIACFLDKLKSFKRFFFGLSNCF
jgi:type II secretory pathway component PulF